MQSECIAEQLEFSGVERRRVVAGFDAGQVTSDGGALLLRQVDEVLRLSERVAGCFIDGRKPWLIEHTVRTLVGQRIFGIALGYEDLNDHDELRKDPMMGVLAGKLEAERADCAPVAGKSTLNRLELHPRVGSSPYHKIMVDTAAFERLFVDLFMDSFAEEPTQILLDLDATDAPLHGEQEDRFFHGYYDGYCYLPLYIFCGKQLLCAKLRPANIDGSAGALEELQRIIGQIRTRWAKVKITLRADSGFCRDALMSWCESEGIDYIFGLARNARLERAIGAQLQEALRQATQTGHSARIFKELVYRTRKTWSRARRVVAKAEATPKGQNPRFIVTSLSIEEYGGKTLYEDLYCARGEMENRIKECQLDMFADRLSANLFRVNQLRLWFASLAYVLVEALRRLGLGATQFARATVGTIRLKLLKIGALISVSVRRVKVALSSGCPYKAEFQAAYTVLHALGAAAR
jgi:Transposase DDE domain group 1